MDGVHWVFTGTAWGNVVQFTDGHSYSFSRRERPHLVFGDAAHQREPCIYAAAVEVDLVGVACDRREARQVARAHERDQAYAGVCGGGLSVASGSAGAPVQRPAANALALVKQRQSM